MIGEKVFCKCSFPLQSALRTRNNADDCGSISLNNVSYIYIVIYVKLKQIL